MPAVLLALAGCAPGPAPHAAATHPGDAHDAEHDAAWSYEGADGPERWGSLSPEYAACRTGHQQSPVDLPVVEGGAGLDVRTDGPVLGRTADNGHTVQFTADDGASTTIDGDDLHLVQVHFHAGSEHTVTGSRAAAEFHFVPADDDGELTVLAVLAECGADNPAYDDYVGGATADRVAGSGERTAVDVAAMLHASRSYATYEGSLTTPPCTEGVRWIVLEDPVELGADQLAELEAAHDGNARPVQPLRGRHLRSKL